MRSLRFRHWPERDRSLFLKFKYESQDPFLDVGHRVLSPHTIKSFEEAHSHVLGFAKKRFPELLNVEPHERLTKPFVRELIDGLEAQCRATTISSLLSRIYYLQRRLSPNVDFSWLRRVANHIRAGADRIRHPVVLSSELQAVGLRGMALAIDRSLPKRRRWRLAYRDALIIAILSEAPMRIGSFRALQLEHFQRIGEHYVVAVPARYTKTRRAVEYQLSSEVSEGIDFYLSSVRPALGRSIASRAFWLSYSGEPITKSGLQQMIPKYTLFHIGVSISAHGFRRAAVALIAYHDSENIMMARDLLDHTNFRMTEQHYLPAAQTIKAGRELVSALRGKVILS